MTRRSTTGAATTTIAATANLSSCTSNAGLCSSDRSARRKLFFYRRWRFGSLWDASASKQADALLGQIALVSRAAAAAAASSFVTKLCSSSFLPKQARPKIYHQKVFETEIGVFMLRETFGAHLEVSQTCFARYCQSIDAHCR